MTSVLLLLLTAAALLGRALAQDAVCYDGLPCFPMTPQWSSPLRPVPAPRSPAQVATTFTLFTRSSQYSGYNVTTWPHVSVDGSDYEGRRRTTWVVQGASSSWNQTWMNDMKNKLLAKEDCNVVLVVWGKGDPDYNFTYLQAVADTRLAGAEMARVGRYLINNKGASASDFHVIGFSLGGQIAGYMGKELYDIGRITVAELKRRWNGLRDAFRREYKKLLKSGQEAPDEFESSWPFFDQMLFLRDVMEPRQLKGNIPLPVKHTETETVSEDAIEEDLELESEKDDSFLENSNSNSAVHHSEPHLAPTALQTMGPPLTTPTKRKPTRLDIDRKNRDRGSPGKSSSNKTKRSVDVSDTHFLEIEKAKLKLLETSASSKNDSEYQFLVSLLPYLKNIPASRQLQVRNKLQQVLIDEQERNSFVAINYKDPLPSTVNQSPGHSSWSNSAYTGCSSDTTSESLWDVTPVNSPLQSFITNFK